MNPNLSNRRKTGRIVTFIALTSEDRQAVYRQRVKGHVDAGRIERLGELSVVHEQEGVTTLTGRVADQAALYSLIVSLPDMGLELLGVQRIDTGSEGEFNSKED